MKWIDKDPPSYVWRNDLWYNEKNGRYYYADLIKRKWINDGTGDEIPFPKKTKIFKEMNEATT